ncbi:MAG: hypothetical protein ABI129_08340 [Rhodanobacter sp.]
MSGRVQKIAHRVATAVIVAALVIGAALTAGLEGSGHLFGLPSLSVPFPGVASVLVSSESSG